MDLDNPVSILTGDEFLPKEGVTFARQVLEFFMMQGGTATSPWGEVLLDMKGIQSDKAHGLGRIKSASFAAIKDVLEKRRLYLHETFLTEKIPEIAASSLVRGSSAASPQSQGSIAKLLQRLLFSK